MDFRSYFWCKDRDDEFIDRYNEGLEHPKHGKRWYGTNYGQGFCVSKTFEAGCRKKAQGPIEDQLVPKGSECNSPTKCYNTADKWGSSQNWQTSNVNAGDILRDSTFPSGFATRSSGFADR